MRIYKCDSPPCENDTHNLEDSEWIEISGGGGVDIRNNLYFRSFNSICTLYSFHFCSERCFISFFISDKYFVKNSENKAEDELEEKEITLKAFRTDMLKAFTHGMAFERSWHNGTDPVNDETSRLQFNEWFSKLINGTL